MRYSILLKKLFSAEEEFLSKNLGAFVLKIRRNFFPVKKTYHITMYWYIANQSKDFCIFYHQNIQ